MDERKKARRYERISTQLKELVSKSDEPIARMATICAVLHHKMDHYFWTGFYLLKEDKLTVGPYQGPVACQVLEKGKGVCWSAVMQEKPVLVPDVHAFPGHIACDPRSRSELVLPVFDPRSGIRAVLDVDSGQPAAFSQTDVRFLEIIAGMVYDR
ncbi:MAG TPA: GAF domain-containing protein [Bacteroides sp.]|nr:GAF domain-containing protein [Bacteroides sp.]